ncbi:MAG: glycoside hydrolase family 1 protein [Anaerolineales bacterium]|jgi:beta-glucosidase
MSTTNHRFQFQPDFRWGTATSSHQVEGGQTNNDWWAAEQRGGFVYKNQKSGQACNWWQDAEADFDRMIDLNLNAHRLSIEWSRVQPTPDTWDEQALERYRTMIAGLIDRGIEPMVTLHHFTLPLWVAALGGWENDDSPEWFETYIRKVVSELSDQVDFWCTINEPMVLIAQGYILGSWPPGKHSLQAALEAGRNMVRAHAAAYHAIHEIQPEARVGMAKHMVVWRPHRFWLPTDRLFSRLINRVSNHMFLDALTNGVLRFPLRKRQRIERAAGTLDWLGVNYYQRFRVGIKIWDALRRIFPGSQTDILHYGTKPGLQKGPGEWGEIHPEGLYETLKSLENYDLPMYITENGIPDQYDRYRPAFIIGHLQQLWRAIQEGIDVRGYYHWSLVDNFEWSEGYDPRFRFGLFGVDIESQERTKRTSAELYGEICSNGVIDRRLIEKYTPALLPDLFKEEQ